MDWKHLLLAAFSAGLITSLTDWFFFGVLFHGKYYAHPEVWRSPPGKSETKTIMIVTLLGFVTSFGFILACDVFAVHGYPATLHLAALVWLLAPLPLIIANALYIKMHPLLVVSHSLGWLAKLVVAAVAATWFGSI